MVARRKMISGGLVAGLVGAVMAPRVESSVDAAATAAGTTQAAEESTVLLKKIYDELVLQREECGALSCPSMGNIRRQQHTHLRAHGRYPEFIDVGLGPWEDLYAWHVKYQLPVKIGMRPDGYYSLPFYLTTIVLKPNMQPDYVGPAYDAGR